TKKLSICCLVPKTRNPGWPGPVVSLTSRLLRMSSKAHHATKAALAGLRSDSIRSAGCRHGYDCTARIEHLSLPEPHRPAREAVECYVASPPGRFDAPRHLCKRRDRRSEVRDPWNGSNWFMRTSVSERSALRTLVL